MAGSRRILLAFHPSIRSLPALKQNDDIAGRPDWEITNSLAKSND